jgi:hypothetical protein
MSLFDKLKDGMNKGVPIPISQQMIHELIKKTDQVTDTTLDIAEAGITVTGKTEVETLLIKKEVSFMIKLLPVKMENREIHFKIEKFKPLNLDFINKKIFNHPPFLSYDGKIIKMDFNGFENVKKIPIGNIKKYELTDGKIILSIGI